MPGVETLGKWAAIIVLALGFWFGTLALYGRSRAKKAEAEIKEYLERKAAESRGEWEKHREEIGQEMDEALRDGDAAADGFLRSGDDPDGR